VDRDHRQDEPTAAGPADETDRPTERVGSSSVGSAGSAGSDVFWLSHGDAKRRHPDQIGPYHIVAVLGQGGMGTVYLAHQDEPKRTVALKVIRADADGSHGRRRFQQEAEALLRLRHKGIAQVFDVGLFESDELGTYPYLAMEHVDGLRLTEHAHRHDLSSRQRLALLAQICHAVHHAHQRNVVHRDLKPSNILVDKTGQPKILDFGLAHLTDSDVRITTVRTNVANLLGTIPYMSPEQITGRTAELDHRSDIYALGVVGYELLVGCLPYDVTHCSIPEAARVIHAADPKPLSTMNRALRGDVETIISKALEKEPERRYQSAADVARDIQHYLDDRPITARPPGTMDQMRKFARRHRALVAGTLAVFLALSAGLVTTTWQAVRANAERRRAEHESQTHREIATFLEDMLSSVDPARTKGHEVTIREFLDSASTELAGSFDERPLVCAALHRTVGLTYRAIGEQDKAEKHLRAAWDTRRRVLGNDNLDTLESAGNLALTLKELGRYDEAERIARAASERAKVVQGPRGEKYLTLLNILGTVLHAYRNGPEVGRIYRTVYEGRVAEYGDGDADTLIPMNNLGSWLMEQGPKKPQKFAEAGRLLKRCLELRTKFLGSDHPMTISTSLNLANWYIFGGNIQAGLPLAKENYDRAVRVLGPTHPRTLNCAKSLVMAAYASGDVEGAVAFARTSYDQALEAHGPLHAGTINSLGLLTNMLIVAGKLQEAEPLAHRCYENAVEHFGAHHYETGKAASLLVDLYEAKGSDALQAQWQKRMEETEFDPHASVPRDDESPGG